MYLEFGSWLRWYTLSSTLSSAIRCWRNVCRRLLANDMQSPRTRNPARIHCHGATATCRSASSTKWSLATVEVHQLLKCPMSAQDHNLLSILLERPSQYQGFQAIMRALPCVRMPLWALLGQTRALPHHLIPTHILAPHQTSSFTLAHRQISPKIYGKTINQINCSHQTLLESSRPKALYSNQPW